MSNKNNAKLNDNNSITINATTTALRYNHQVRFPNGVRAKSSSEDSSDSDDEVIADTLEY